MHRSINRFSHRAGLLRRAVEALETRFYLSVSFGNPVTLSTTMLGIAPVSALLADFNGDGKADLVVANSTDSVSVLSGNGDGTFANASTIPVAGSPVPLGVGNFDSTGNLGIVAGTTATPGAVDLIAGNGNGTFAAADNIPALDNNQAIAVGDFVTGEPEDVITVSNSPTPSNNTMLLLGNGTGGLTAQAPFSLPFGSVSAVAVGDFNGDGNLDFVVADEANNSVSVFFGNGNGTFQSPQTYSAGPSPTSVVVGNFSGKELTNGQPELDIVTADSTGGEISYLANNGSGTFAAPVDTPITASAMGGGPTQLIAGDFNNDGKTDLAALLSPGGSADAAVLLGNGNGTFTAATNVTAGGSAPTSIAVGDLNGDGLPDLVLTSGTQVTSLLNTSVIGTTASVTTLQSSDLTVVAGGSVTLTATVTDSTNASIPTGSVEFDLDGAPIGAAVLDSGIATLITTLPAAGNQSITASYGGDSTFGESNSSPVTIDVTATATLTPVIARSTLPANAIGGIAAHGTVTVNVTNTTLATTKGITTVTVYASSDGIVDGTSVALGSAKHGQPIKAGATIAVHVPLKLPATLAVGSYTLLAQTVDPSGNASTAVTGTSLTVAAPVISLAETFKRLVLPADVVAGSKTSAVALLGITNSGNVTSTGITGISLYASTDGIAADGTLIKSISRRLTIGAGRSTAVSVPLGAYPLVADGDYSIVAEATDPKGNLSSAVSTSTVNIAAARVDLAGAFTAVPAMAVVGKAIEVTLAVSNNGNISVTGPLQIAIASSSTSDGSDAVSLETLTTHINLRPGQVQQLHLRAMLPLGSPTGNMFLVATIDPNQVLGDSNLANNTAVSGTAVSVSG